MVNKRFCLGMLVMTIVFGMTVFGCKDEPNDGNDNGGNSVGSTDTALNGTWVNYDGDELKLNNGNIELSYNGIVVQRGTYSTSSGKMTIQITHYHGSMLNPMFELDSKMYSRNELETAFKALGVTDEEITRELNKMFSPVIFNYSVNGNILTLSLDGYTETYTRK
jgi:hypothetical protein